MRFSKPGSKGSLYILLSFAAYAFAQSGPEPTNAALNSEPNTDTTGNLLPSNGPSIATYSGTQTLTLGPTLTTTVYGDTLTVQPVTTVLATLPAGGSLTTVSSGSSTNSYYVYSTAASSLDMGSDASLCFDCCLWPCIVTGAQAAVTPVSGLRLGGMDRARLVTGGGDEPGTGTCPTARPGTGTTTVFTTSTLTQCDAQPICPSPGWGIITQSNVPGASTVHTGNAQSSTSFVQIPTTASSAGPSSTPSSTSSPTCPYDTSTAFTDYYGSQYRIQCDTLFTNTVLDTQTQIRLSDCIIACDKYSRDNIGGAQCQGASWISDQANDNCLLFDGSDGIAQIGTYSATLLTGLATPPGDGGNDTSPTSALTSIGSIITPTAVVTSPPVADPYTSTEYGISTAVSTVVGSNGVTSLVTYDVTTAISQHMVNRLVTTLTVTTVSVSMGISYFVSYIVSTAAGPTQTVAGATVTLHDGPTVTSFGIRTVFAGPTVTTYGGTRTETTTVGTAGTETIHDVSTAPTETTTLYLYPSKSSTSSYCRPFPTEYLHGAVPVKKRDVGVVEGLIDIGSYAPMLAVGDKPRALY